jgi:hypothetical protein
MAQNKPSPRQIDLMKCIRDKTPDPKGKGFHPATWRSLTDQGWCVIEWEYKEPDMHGNRARHHPRHVLTDKALKWFEENQSQ